MVILQQFVAHQGLFNSFNLRGGGGITIFIKYSCDILYISRNFLLLYPIQVMLLPKDSLLHEHSNGVLILLPYM